MLLLEALIAGTTIRIELGLDTVTSLTENVELLVD